MLLLLLIKLIIYKFLFTHFYYIIIITYCWELRKYAEV